MREGTIGGMVPTGVVEGGVGRGGGIMQEGHAHVLVAYRRRLAPFFASLRCSYPMLLWMECRWDAGRGGRDH